MASFTQLEEDNHALDWEILRDGGVSLYRRRDYLKRDIAWLEAQGYKVFTFNCSSWFSEAVMHDQLASTLSFPDYYGKNFDALNECAQDDLVVPDEGGTALVFDGFDAYARGAGAACPGSKKMAAEIVLDIVARASRHFLLRGRRLVTLVRSDDPLLSFEGLDGVATSWNRQEWLNKDRGV